MDAKQYKVTSPIWHDLQRYMPGQTIELGEKDAVELAAIKAIDPEPLDNTQESNKDGQKEQEADGGEDGTAQQDAPGQPHEGNRAADVPAAKASGTAAEDGGGTADAKDGPKNREAGP